MKTKGIEVYINQNEETEVWFPEILKQISDGESFLWSVLFIDAWRDDNGEKSSVKVHGLERGLILNWNDLNAFTSNLFNLLEAVVIGCKNEKYLRDYEDEQEMFETCDITINNIDGCYWEIFSKDDKLITHLAAKFNRHKLLDSDFLKV